MSHGFIRIVQGLFAAALLFQGFEYLQKPHYILSDIPTLHRLAPSYKAKEAKKKVTKAQAPDLRLFPDLNEGEDTNETSKAVEKQAAKTPPKPEPKSEPEPEAETPPEPPGGGDYLTAALEAGLAPMGFEEVQAASTDGFTLLIDARDKNLYDDGHIPGAVSIPYEFAIRKSLNGLLKSVTEDFSKPTVVYCGDKFCAKAFNLTKQLTELGHGDVYLYADGFSDWDANGGTVETSADAPKDSSDKTGSAAKPQDPGDAPVAGTPAPVPSASISELNTSPKASNKMIPAEKVKSVFSGGNKQDLAMFIIPWLFIGLGLLTLLFQVEPFTWILRICIGVLFIYSGLQKIIAPATFAQNIACYMMVPSEYVNMMAFVLPPLEVIAGAALIFLPYVRQAAAFLVFLMLVMFIGATGMALWQGLEIDCGCGTTSKPLEWSKIAKNTIYALGCLALMFYVPKRLKDGVSGTGRPA